MINNKLPFIVFEGVDGSGKSTQADMLHAYFKQHNLPVFKGVEPTDGEWGKKIRNILQGNTIPSGEEQLELFLRDREDDVTNNIVPALRNNQAVILDRYYFSNAAYQGAMGLSPEKIIWTNRERNFPVPDRVYLIDLTPDQAFERITKRNDRPSQDIFEKISFLTKVREIYLAIADSSFMIIDGNQSIDDVFNEIKTDIHNHFINTQGFS